MLTPPILFAWEAGENLGHVFPLAEIARAFSGQGFGCCFASRDLASARLALAGTGIALLQAPCWPTHVHSGNEDGQSSYADMLALLGFGDTHKLAAMLEAWNALLDLVKPGLVIADHCPALLPLLQARGIACVAVGTGFTMPPLEYAVLPALRADRGPLLPEQKLLASLTAALASLGLAAPASLSRAFSSTARVVYSFPELDAYRSWRREPLFLPPEPLPPFVDPPLGAHLFVYAGCEFPGLEELVQVLAALPFAVSCYLRNAPPALNMFLRLRGKTAFDQPPRLADHLPKVSHVLSQGGNFMSHAAMAAGRPHLILPLHGETLGNLEALKALGLARGLAAPFKDNLRRQIEHFVGDTKLLLRAQQWSMLVAARRQASGRAATLAAVSACLELSAGALADRPASLHGAAEIRKIYEAGEEGRNPLHSLPA